MGEGLVNGRVLYYDPNGVRISGSNDNSIFNRDLTKDPEDLSIAVDLQVVTKKRGSIYSEENGTTTTWSLIGSGTKVNFLGGSNLDGGKNSNVLTDFFSNIGDKKDGVVENLPEAMCINSIDIEFSSWYAASVSITFTDVRGAALFSSADYVDYLKDNNQPAKDDYESFYKTFFSFPYPMYKLKVKGFYGDAVTYPLHCSDFKAQFNSATGNFDVTVSFIGYTYAMLNDVIMPYLIAAPYCEYEGKTYWESEVTAGRFISSEGNPLPTLYELISKIKNGDYEVEKISQGKLSTDLESTKTELAALQNIFGKIYEYLSRVVNTLGGKFIENSKYTINEIPNTSQSVLTTQLTDDIKAIDGLITEFKNKFTKSTVFSTYKGVDDLNLKLNGSFKTIDFKQISDIFIAEEVRLNNLVKNSIENLDVVKNNTLTNAYGMSSNIFNYFKVLVAHMETFYHMIETCSKKIGVDREFGNIPFGSTDGNTQTGKNNKPILSPFPWVTKKGKFDRIEDEWIGNYDSNLEEVKLVENLIKSKTDIQNKINELLTSGVPEPNPTPNDVTGLTIGDIWLPMHPFDNSISLIGGKDYLPWQKDIKKTEEKNLMLYDRAYLRTLIPTLFSGGNNINVGKQYSYAEAFNIYDQIKGDLKLGAEIQIAIKDLNGSLGYNSIKGNKFGPTFNNSDLTTKSEINKVYIPFFEDDPSVHRANLIEGRATKAKLEKKLWYYNYETRPSINKKILDKRYDNQQSFIIVNNGYLNTYPDKIYNEYYLKVKDRINKELIPSGKADKGIIKILNNYNFDNDKNEIITYKYFEVHYNNKLILNKITNKRLEFTTLPGLLKDTYTSAGITASKDYKFNYGLNINNLYKIYGGYDKNSLTNDVELKKQYNKLTSTEKDNFINEKSYPFIGGYTYIYKGLRDDDGLFFSLFGHPFYYSQTNRSGNIDDYLTAYLFLSSLNINTDETEKTILSNLQNLTKDNCYDRSSYMSRIPKSNLLLIGGLLWRYINASKKYDFLKYGQIEVPSITQYFKRENTLAFDYKNRYDESKLFIKYEDGGKKLTTPILDNVEIKFFTDIFEKFVLNEWKLIKNGLELEINTGNGFARPTGASLSLLLDKLYDKFNDNTVGEVDYNNNLLYYFNTKNNPNINNYSYIMLGINNLTRYSVETLYYNQYLLLINKDTDITKKILKLILEDCVLVYSGNKHSVSTNDIIESQKNNLKIINETIKPLLENPTNASDLGLNNSLATNQDKKDIVSVDYNEDLRLATYTYIKTLYDKWVSGWLGKNGQPYKWIINELPPQNSDLFKAIPDTVGKSYIKNFRFIDRAHNDIGVDMLINYRNAISGLIDTAKEKTLFSTMTDVLQQNSMLFLPMPSYQSFNDIDDLEKVFKPIPFSGSKMISDVDDLDSAMYLCMYAGRPSSRLNLGPNAALADDGYPLNLPTTPNDYKNDGDSKVPAIAVNFGQQNQQYFKNFSLNMSNPNTTDASINVLRNLNERANQNSTVEPIGQDMFSLYSQYSYTCDVEMMGCAQIQPMMYFQLANIPMWNGAYMIYKVKHSIKPGNMTTSFTGMRMAKTYPKLIKQNMLTFKLQDGLSGLNDGLAVPTGGDPNKMISFTANEKFRDNFDYFKIADYVDGNLTSIPENIYNILKNYTSIMVEEINRGWEEITDNKYKLYIYSGYRKRGGKNASDTSVHPLGLAVDLHITNQDGNKSLNRELQNFIKEKMTKGFRVDQVLFEKEETYWVHVGFVDPNGQAATIINGQYKTRGEYFDMVDHKPTEEFAGKKKPTIPQAIWPNNNSAPVVKIEDSGKAGNSNVQSVFSYFKNNTTLNNAQIAGIMGNIYQESKFIPIALSKKTSKEHSYGLVQWNSKWYPVKDSTITELKNAAGDTVQEQLNFLISTSGYKDYIVNTKSSNSPEECAKIFCEFYERPGDMEYQKELRSGFGRYYYNNVVNK